MLFYHRWTPPSKARFPVANAAALRVWSWAIKDIHHRSKSQGIKEFIWVLVNLADEMIWASNVEWMLCQSLRHINTTCHLLTTWLMNTSWSWILPPSHLICSIFFLFVLFNLYHFYFWTMAHHNLLISSIHFNSLLFLSI